MTTVTSSTGATPTTGATGTPKKNPPPGGEMGKDQFLQLLVAQMKNQDPMNPMDGQQMAAQLAQFSSVEQLIEINKSLATQATGQTGVATLLAENGALSAVGKTVLIAADAVDTKGGAPTEVLADIPADAVSAKLRVYDASGAEVATQDLGVASAGRQRFTLGSATQAIAGGSYKYVVETTDKAGVASSAPTYVRGTVSGVRFTSAGPTITVGKLSLPWMSVVEIGA